MHLLRIKTNTDWKGRPSHNVDKIHTSDNLEDIFRAMDADIINIMVEDIIDDRELELQEQDEEYDPTTKHKETTELKNTPSLADRWTQGNERFEMTRERDEQTRKLVYVFEDGGTASITYFITDDNLATCTQYASHAF